MDLCDCISECIGPDARSNFLCRAEEGKLCGCKEGDRRKHDCTHQCMERYACKRTDFHWHSTL